jgi:ABC-type lipoprotein export system ATPase subunit
VALLRLDNVSKDYATDGERVHAVHSVSLDLDPGEFVALMGKSGCGKSTLLNLSGAMDLPTAGRVLLDGADTSTLGDAGLTRLRREKVGFVFQSFQLLNTLTVLENVELPLLLAGKRDTAAASERLELVGMEQEASRYPHQLSGGQMQRVAIARALVHRPRLLLADEPTGNLDTATGQTILEVLHRAAKVQGAAVLMATHSPESAAVTDRIVRMRDGHIEGIERN